MPLNAITLGWEVGTVTAIVQSGTDQILSLAVTDGDGLPVDMTGVVGEITSSAGSWLADGDATGEFRWRLTAAYSSELKRKAKSMQAVLLFRRGDVVSVIARGEVVVR